MSKEIFVNTGGSFQQQYTARQPAIGTAPTIANTNAQGNANVQTPFTFQGRNPSIYQNNVNTQTPYQANTQSIYSYQANAQSQATASAQTAYPYIANRQNTYQYQANTQTTYQYQATNQTPFTYQHRQPGTYPVAAAQGQQPYIANARQPGTYATQGQTPTTYARQGQTPFTYSNRSPSIVPYTTQGQTPFTYDARSPFTYPTVAGQPASTQVTGQLRSEYSNQNQIVSRTPVQTQTQTSGGPTGQYQPVDYMGNPGGNNVVHEASGNIYGYVGYRKEQQDFRMTYWRHTNGHVYTYWYVKRGSGSGIPLNTYVAQVPLYSGTVTYDTTNWRLVEQFDFWYGFQPDKISLGNSGINYGNGDLTLSTSGTSSYWNASLSACGESISYKLFAFECEEGFSMGSTSGTTVMRPTMVKSGYPNLVGTDQGIRYEYDVYCSFGCFTADSQVLLEDGTTKNIQDMVAGDKCYGKDDVINAVKELKTHTSEDVPIYTVNGDLELTGAHPILTTTGWKSCNSVNGNNLHPELDITELTVGDMVVKCLDHEGNQETIEVTSITVDTKDNITVYNLDVTDAPSGNDTYVVNNYVVHNK